MKLAQRLVELALKEVGVEEVGNTNCGDRVNFYKTATWLPCEESWPWCAAFIDWLIWTAMIETKVKYSFERPQTAGAWDLENWSLKQDGSTQTKRDPGVNDIKAGDIVIFKFSHVGLAIGSPVAGMIPTIEGNSDAEGSREGGGVWKHYRKFSSVKTRIRFTV
tara:strand:- start:399 stop:887 length:489 start_codon:yes stop_codon:yes gene_type:complete